MRTVKQQILACATGASVLLGAAPAFSQTGTAPLVASPTLSVPAASAVSAFYSTRSQPIWFQGGVAGPATVQLINILKRAPFDGLAIGPQLASQVESALLLAQSGRPADIGAADRTLSTAWVTYVQALKQPTRGMIYAYSVLQPQGTRADQILLTAAAAPSLEAHVQNVSRVNSIYAQLRDAAWNQALATGSMVPDPRLLANLERARPIPATGRFVLVDAGSQQLWMYENGQPVDSMKVIVGTNEFPTPMIASFIHYAVFNPYWNVPNHLVRKTVAPNVLKQGLGYLKSRGYQVMTDWTADAGTIPSDQIDWKAAAAGTIQIRVREMPGEGNSMGDLKFPFPNGEGIFLHDTPNKALFAKSQRMLSNGCIRLEDARRLGRWLLGREPVAPSADAEAPVQLPQGVPVYVTYLTAQAKDGTLTYVNDVYGWDRSPPTQFAAR